MQDPRMSILYAVLKCLLFKKSWSLLNTTLMNYYWDKKCKIHSKLSTHSSILNYVGIL